MKRLYLVRHGSTDWSDAGRLNGHTDVPLNEKGRAQARALGHRLSHRTFDGIWSSDLSRAVETASIAYGEATPTAGLRELDFGTLEGKRWSEIEVHLQRALIGFSGFAAPQGETVDALYLRVNEFVNALAPGRHLVFTHGGVIRALQRTLSEDHPVRPGEVVVIKVGPCSRLTDSYESQTRL